MQTTEQITITIRKVFGSEIRFDGDQSEGGVIGAVVFFGEGIGGIGGVGGVIGSTGFVGSIVSFF